MHNSSLQTMKGMLRNYAFDNEESDESSRPNMGPARKVMKTMETLVGSYQKVGESSGRPVRTVRVPLPSWPSAFVAVPSTVVPFPWDGALGIGRKVGFFSGCLTLPSPKGATYTPPPRFFSLWGIFHGLVEGIFNFVIREDFLYFKEKEKYL